MTTRKKPLELILVRGLPGSGKTTYAKSLRGYRHVETDQFFVKGGHFKYDISRLRDAHQWCLKKTATLLEQGKSIVVSNTFTQHWEMELYFNLALKVSPVIRVVHCVGEFESVHPVSLSKMAVMRNRWQPYLGEEIYLPLLEKPSSKQDRTEADAFRNAKKELMSLFGERVLDAEKTLSKCVSILEDRKTTSATLLFGRQNPQEASLLKEQLLELHNRHAAEARHRLKIYKRLRALLRRLKPEDF